MDRIEGVVGREGIEPPQSKTADLQSAELTTCSTYPRTAPTLRDALPRGEENDLRSSSSVGADDGTRTRNRRFTKPLLYQLSYVGGDVEGYRTEAKACNGGPQCVPASAGRWRHGPGRPATRRGRRRTRETRSADRETRSADRAGQQPSGGDSPASLRCPLDMKSGPSPRGRTCPGSPERLCRHPYRRAMHAGHDQRPRRPFDGSSMRRRHRTGRRRDR